MTKQEFITALRDELTKLPPEEIVEATEYFEECFAEATDGLDAEAAAAEEERLAAEFGNPKKIASQIKADYAARILDNGETAAGEKPGTKNKISAVWWVIIGICSAPIAIPLATGVIVMILAIYIAIIACILGGLTMIGVGFAALGSSISGGIMTIGGGFMLTAVSAAAAFGAFMGTKAIIVAIARSVRESSQRKKAEKALAERGE